MKTELNSVNGIEAVITLAMPVVMYSFNIMNWTVPEIRRLDTKIHKLLICNRMHHPKADVDRLYILRNKVIQPELSYKLTTNGLPSNNHRLHATTSSRT